MPKGKVFSGRLKDHVAIVTGAAQGIGYSTAFKLAEEGASVALFDMSAESLKEAEVKICALGVRAKGFVVDISKEDEVQEAVNTVQKEFGSLEIMVNAAGVWSFIPLEQLTFREWKRIQAVNLDGTFLISRAAYIIMKEARYGRIINIGSSAFFLGSPWMAHYTASKGGVIGLTRSIASEGGEHGITANVVAPGLTNTEGGKSTFGGEDYVKTFVDSQLQVKRLGEPYEIAEAVAYLASPAAGYITGQTINVNGGSRYT